MQIMKCNPWSTKFCPYPSLIQKRKTYLDLELEGKLGLKPRLQHQMQSTSAPPQNNNPMTKKAPGPKMFEQKKRRIRVPTKRRHKVRVIALPIPTTPMATVPVNSTQLYLPPSSHCLHPNACGKVHSHAHTSNGIKFGNRENLLKFLIPQEDPRMKKILPFTTPTLQHLEDIPNAPVRQDTPWASTEPASENLFKTRKDWPIPPTPAINVKTEVPPQTAVIPHALVMPKQVVEKCTWGPHCPICIKEEEEGQED